MRGIPRPPWVGDGCFKYTFLNFICQYYFLSPFYNQYPIFSFYIRIILISLLKLLRIILSNLSKYVIVICLLTNFKEVIILMESTTYSCPVCKSKDLFLKHEASYVYSYVLDSDAPGIKNADVFSPFLYDRRDQTSSLEYIECECCKTRFPSEIIYRNLESSVIEKSDINI